MIFNFHPEAESEFNEALEYYREIDIRLGRGFAIEVHACINRILKNPKAWTLVEDGVRRTLIKRFPYGILYSIEDDVIFILAVMNLHRHPDYWKNRI